MSDVFDEIISRLTQKAKNLTQIEYELNRMYDKTRTIERLEEVDREFRKIKWVRLEDVQKLLQEIKEKYVLVSKEKFVHLFGWLKGNINLNYGGRNREQLLRWVNELEELLKK